VGATPSRPISNPPTSIPPIFTPDHLPAAILPIYSGLGQAKEYAGLHTPVAWLWYSHNGKQNCQITIFDKKTLQYCVPRNVPPLASYNIETLQPMLIIWQNFQWESKWSKQFFISSPHLTSVSALPAKTGNLEMISFHSNAVMLFCRHTKHIHNITWSQLQHPHSHNDRLHASNRTLTRCSTFSWLSYQHAVCTTQFHCCSVKFSTSLK